MGKYVDKSLISGEKIVYETRLHWINYWTLSGVLTLFIVPIINAYTSEYAITDKRVITKEGLIKINTLELQLNQVESIQVHQSILGRILNYGVIKVIGTGGTNETFTNIAKPMDFRRAFHNASL